MYQEDIVKQLLAYADVAKERMSEERERLLREAAELIVELRIEIRDLQDRLQDRS